VVGSFLFFLVTVWIRHVDSVNGVGGTSKSRKNKLDSGQQKLTAAMADDRNRPGATNTAPGSSAGTPNLTCARRNDATAHPAHPYL
jgi:hypothetical protein